MEQLRPVEQPLPFFNAPIINTPVTNAPLPVEQIPVTHTKEFSVDQIKDEQTKIKIDFFGGDKPNEFINKPTETAKPVDPASNQNTFLNPGQQPSFSNPTRTKEEIRGSMSVLISLIDYGLSVLGQWLAGEGNQSQYTADTAQKKILENALTDYFFEKQIKMNAGLTLILAFTGCYGFMLLKAGKKRLDIIKLKKNPNAVIKKTTVDNKPVTGYRSTVTDEEIERLKNLTVPVKPSIQKPILQSVYTENKKDGTMELQRLPAWLNPAQDIVAQNRIDLDKYIGTGIFPMYLKSAKGKTWKIKYDPTTGKPLLKGKAPRIK